ncbi:hypothetical protein [Nocardia amamiensis]|uniref:hypothetical protein n=1 Tax=Nocardia amamiensis TaxID=404578 RepID=UPI003405E317
MTDLSPTAFALARMRAEGCVPAPDAATTLALWREAAERAGRSLCQATLPGRRLVFALGWIDGSEPAADTGMVRAKPPTVLLLIFAAALRACWPDRSAHPFPGIAVDEDVVLDSVAALGPLTKGTVEGGEGGRRHRKGALRRLHEAGLLILEGTDVRLGLVVATWSDTQVAAVRAVYDQLPLTPTSRSEDEK